MESISEKESKSLLLYEYPFIIPKDLKLNISLNEIETKIFKFLLSNNPSKSIFRVAGGWVRDKLLGKENDDIDITIDNITGQQYLSIIESSLNNKDTNTNTLNTEIKIIKNSNKKSSQLQTATINIFGKDIDFVNLRKEVYTKNNRVPEISFGTPEEDSYRRDITINCLFYNINEEKIEDFTGKGLNDLKNGIVNTPKESKISFEEDPLRVLRVIRFTTRFQFRINDDVFKNLFISDFINILSLQRIEKEISKMFENNHYYAAIYFLYKFKYLQYILNLNNYLKNIKIHHNSCTNIISNVIDNDFYIISAVNLILIKSFINRKKLFENEGKEENKEKFKVMNYTCLLMSYKNLDYYEKKNKFTQLTKFLSFERLCLTKKEINDIHFLIEGTNDLLKLIHSKDSNNSTFNKVEVTLLIMKYKFRNIFSFIQLAICDDYLKEIDYNKNEIIKEINNEKFQNICDNYNKYLEYINDNNIKELENLKPLFDGKDIKKELNIKDGKVIKKCLDIILEEQIKNPKINKEEIIYILKSNINK